MIRDNFLEFSVAQDLTGGTGVSTNVVDMLNARDPGPGNTVIIPVTANVGFTGGTSLQIQLQESVDNSTYVTVEETAAIPLAALTLGNKIATIKVPQRPASLAALPRYMRLNYIVVGTMTAGKVDAGVVLDSGSEGATTYPAGVTVTN
jgi:hypothetical protein